MHSRKCPFGQLRFQSTACTWLFTRIMSLQAKLTPCQSAADHDTNCRCGGPAMPGGLPASWPHSCSVDSQRVFGDCAIGEPDWRRLRNQRCRLRCVTGVEAKGVCLLAINKAVCLNVSWRQDSPKNSDKVHTAGQL